MAAGLNWWWMCGRLSIDRGRLRYVLRFGDKGVARMFKNKTKRGSILAGGVRFSGEDIPWALELAGAPEAVTAAVRECLEGRVGALERLTELLAEFSGGAGRILAPGTAPLRD